MRELDELIEEGLADDRANRVVSSAQVRTHLIERMLDRMIEEDLADNRAGRDISLEDAIELFGKGVREI